MSELSVNEKVINYILKMLKGNYYKENYKLPTESELADKLSVSRNSVREALKTLQNIGIIYSIRGSGYKTEPDLENSLLKTAKTLFEVLSDKYSCRDISEIREALELKTILLLQKKEIDEDENDIVLLRSYVENMKNDINPEYNDQQFHLKLAEMTGNVLINFISKAILLRTAEDYILIPWNKIDDEQKEKLIRSHEEIIDWIIDRTHQIIINENPISKHYMIADNIIQKKSKIYNNDLLQNYTMSELLEMGITDAKIKELIKEYRSKNN